MKYRLQEHKHGIENTMMKTVYYQKHNSKDTVTVEVATVIKLIAFFLVFLHVSITSGIPVFSTVPASAARSLCLHTSFFSIGMTSMTNLSAATCNRGLFLSCSVLQWKHGHGRGAQTRRYTKTSKDTGWQYSHRLPLPRGTLTAPTR